MTKFDDEESRPKRRRPDDNVDHSKGCAFEYRGEKCQRLGSMSHGTKGDGPWYCRDHFFGRTPGKWTADVDWRKQALADFADKANRERRAIRQDGDDAERAAIQEAG